MKILKYLILFCYILNYFNSFVYSVAKEPKLIVDAIIMDQHPFYNNNFEPDFGSLTTKIVLPKIDTITRTPKIVSSTSNYTTANSNGKIYSPHLFQYFFNANQINDKSKNSGLNYPLTKKLTFNLNDDGEIYTFDNQSFFPIDGLGFEQDSTLKKYYDDKGRNHNYHFCLKLHSRFSYRGVEKFEFIGDDDVWVFIDDQLVIDLGGLHTAEKKVYDLTKAGYIVGKTYRFDFFYCERHTTLSTIKIQTSIELACEVRDYCGVCGGNGESCCNPIQMCNDNNPCTKDLCPLPSEKIDPNDAEAVRAACQHIPIEDHKYDDNACKYSVCNTTNGKFDVFNLVCGDKTNECKKYEYCDERNGCKYSQVCTDVCHVADKCDNGKCVTKSSEYCAKELDGDNPDPCSIYECKPIVGCSKREKCPQGPNACKKDFCNAGTCESTPIPPETCNCTCPQVDNNKCLLKYCLDSGICEPKPVIVEDGNECTKDECDPETGIITHTPSVTCDGCSFCNTKSGKCEGKDEKCNDSNKCTDDICMVKDNNGTCTTKNANCVPSKPNKCKIYSCDADKGCLESDRVCPDAGLCSIGACDPLKGDEVTGCYFKQRECPETGHFCLETECNERYGCIVLDKICAAEDGRCQKGICRNQTEKEEGGCDSVDYDPQPFICKTAAVVSTAVVAGVVVAGAVALGAAIFAGKKGYDYWKTNQGQVMASSNANPLYESSPNGGENPLFQGPTE